MDTKRINLSFNLEHEDDLKVFKIISDQKYKTDFVINAVIKYLEEISRKNDKEVIKQAMREVLKEHGTINIGSSINTLSDPKKEELPSEIFDMFNNL
jgi:hypothetical protein